MNIYIKNLNLSLPVGREKTTVYAPSTKENCKDGVYIYTQSGKFWLPQYWGLSNEPAFAVALVKGDTKLLVALKGSEEGIELLPDGYKIALDEYKSIEDALKDKSGKEATDKLFKAGSKAALFCREFGPSWYLPTLSDMQSLYESKKEVDSAITIACGEPLPGRYHWTSTRYNNACNWIFDWSNGDRGIDNQNDYCRVRPVSAFL